jgi:hypothetical protein
LTNPYIHIFYKSILFVVGRLAEYQAQPTAEEPEPEAEHLKGEGRKLD